MAAEATELECLNRMLIGALSHPATATTDNRPDVQNALQILQETDRDLQAQGHFFNTTYNEVITLATDRIPATAEMYAVNESSGEDQPGREYPSAESYSLRYESATRYVYDNNNHTFDFAADLTVNVVYRIPFGELPQYAREYITSRACAEFYELVRGKRSARLEDREQQARASFHQSEQDIGGFNTFDNPHDSWVHYNR
jgi:hypothetical protein